MIDFLKSIINQLFNAKRIKELEKELFVCGDRRDWNGSDRAQAELDRLLKRNQPLSHKTKLDIEIERVSAAYNRYECETNQMYDIWVHAGRLCCPYCFHGSKYGDLVEKKERVQLQLNKLLAKKQKML